MLQNFPSVLHQTLSANLGCARCCTVTDEDDTTVLQPQLPSSRSFSEPVQQVAEQLIVSTPGRKLSLSKSLTWVINWFHAPDVDLFFKSFQALVPHGDKCLNREGDYVDKWCLCLCTVFTNSVHNIACSVTMAICSLLLERTLYSTSSSFHSWIFVRSQTYKK